MEIVDVNIDNQRAYLGDVITFTPELEFALDSMALNFDYKWELDGKVLGTERILEWTADTAGMFWEGFVFTVRRISEDCDLTAVKFHLFLIIEIFGLWIFIFFANSCF